MSTNIVFSTRLGQGSLPADFCSANLCGNAPTPDGESISTLKITSRYVIAVMARKLDIELLQLPSHRCVLMLPAPLPNLFGTLVQALARSLVPDQEAALSVLTGDEREAQKAFTGRSWQRDDFK